MTPKNVPPGMVFFGLALIAALAGTEMFSSRVALALTIFFGLAAIVLPILAAIRDVTTDRRRDNPTPEEPRP